jgi:serine/threonine-protein kinase
MQKGDLIRGKYRLVRLLGDGGMGSVFEAYHEGLGTRVAIKVLHPDLARRAGLVERFLREARVSAQIKSANVVQVMDVERTDDGVAYIVMELLEGEPLSSALERERKFSVGVACDYGIQILRALEAAHALGVVHRDLKPENVFVTFVSGKPLLKLIDFGIAKAREMDSQAKNLTVAGVVMGTPEYMSPEQAHSADKVDARSDIYAVGVMLYEMISGARPVTGEDAHLVAIKIQRGEVRPLVHAAPGVPPDLAGIVHRAMAARPELRFSSATELRLALEASVAGKRATTAGATGGSFEATQAGPGGVASATVMGAPANQTFRTASHTPVAMTGGYGPVWQGSGGAPAAPSPGGAPRMASGYEPRSRRKGSSVWLLIALPVLLGGGIVAAFAFNGSSGAPSSPPPTPTPSAVPDSVASITANSAAPAPPPNATVTPLLPATPVPHAAAPASGPLPTPKPHPSSSPSAAPSAAEPSSPFPFPSGFPGIPNPFPLPSSSGVGPVFTIPTSLPFPFPGAPPPDPPSAPTPAPSGKAI